MEKITINGKVYQAREVDFNFVCELGNEGITLTEITKKMFPAIRVYAAYCMGLDPELAGEEINNHILNGGDFSELLNVFQQKAEESGFFQALGKKEEKATTASTKKKNSKTEETEA